MAVSTEHRHARHARLRAFLRSLTWLLGACEAVYAALALTLASRLPLVLVAGNGAVLLLVVAARWLVSRDRDTLAVSLLSYGFLVVAAGCSSFLPSLYPTVILGCAVVLAMALPWLRGRALVALSGACLLATVVVAAQGMLRPAMLDVPPGVETAIVVFTIAAAMVGLLLLLRQFSERIHRNVSELEAALSARDEFLSIASHELNTPLTALQLQLQGLERRLRDLPPSQVLHFAQRVSTARRQAARLTRLVDGLLDVSRLRTGTFALSVEAFDLSDLVRDIAERFTEEARAAGCALTVKADDAIAGTWDRLRVEQVIVNLLGNAMKYAPNQPVELEVRTEGDTVAIAIVDHGLGIDPGDLHRIFEPYERAVPSGHYGGLGLGLYIARNIVEAHGGNIGVTSKVGEGTAFTVRLPLRRSQPPAVARTGS